jgi:hypothetical protein
MSSFKFNSAEFISALISGIIIGGIGAYLTLQTEIAELKAKVEVMQIDNQSQHLPNININNQNDNKNVANNDKINEQNQLNTRVPNVPPGKIFDIIRDQQNFFVKESYGTDAYQCFTDDDLQNFLKKGVPQIIRDNLQKSNEYLAIIMAIKEMDAIKRQELLNHAQNSFKPTWGELGHISREGQTDAGQTAEKLIANSIVDLTKGLLNKTNEELNAMLQ